MTTDYGPIDCLGVDDPLDVPPLQIDKTSSPSSSPVASGDTIDYTIRVFAADSTPLTNVAVTDSLPTGAVYQTGTVAADLNGTPIAASGPPALVTGLTMNPGDMLTITFTADVPAPDACGSHPVHEHGRRLEHRVPDSGGGRRHRPGRSLGRPLGHQGRQHRGASRLRGPVHLHGAGRQRRSRRRGLGDRRRHPASRCRRSMPALSDPSCVEAPAGTVTCSLGSLAAGATTSVDLVVDIDGGFVGSAQQPRGGVVPDPGPRSDQRLRHRGDAGGGTAFHHHHQDPVDRFGQRTRGDGHLLGRGPQHLCRGSDVDVVWATAVFGDLLAAANPAISNNDCDDQATAIPAGSTFACSFDAALPGDAGDPDHVNTVTAAACRRRGQHGDGRRSGHGRIHRCAAHGCRLQDAVGRFGCRDRRDGDLHRRGRPTPPSSR